MSRVTIKYDNLKSLGEQRSWEVNEDNIYAVNAVLNALGEGVGVRLSLWQVIVRVYNRWKQRKYKDKYPLGEC